ncbi:RTA1-like protein [Mycena crocata]|nr:RTA1-like protein [Mycena crocata]
MVALDLTALASISELAIRAAPPRNQYGYVPDRTVAILFLVLFGISTALHVGQTVYYRMWWLLPTAALCGVGELIGWAADFGPRTRLLPSRRLPSSEISTTIIAPTPLLAATFIIMSRVIHRLGSSYARLTPKWYTMLFLPCDLIALIVQGVGGGMASSAEDLDGANVGANVMLGGIVFQFVVIILFSALSLDYVQRYLRDRPTRIDGSLRGALTPSLKAMLAAMALSTTCLFIRSVYRIIELTDGWRGRIIHTEVYFNVLDGGMVVLAIFVLNFAHPGLLLTEGGSINKDKLEPDSKESSRPDLGL